MANVVLNMSLSDIRTTDANAAGTITITDLDGDTITADINGTWTPLGIFASFSGSLSNVLFHSTGDGTFEGSNNGVLDGAFAMDFGEAPLSGAILQLALPNNWFADGSFSDANTLIEASVIPAPSATLLAAIGLGLAGWVRKRLAQ
jgi:hypothetical protein